MKLFNVTAVKLFSASSVYSAINHKKPAIYEFVSLCGQYTCTVKAKPSRSHSEFDADIALVKADQNCEVINDRSCASVADLKDFLRTCFETWNEQNPVPIKKSNIEIFQELPMGEPLQVVFANGRVVTAIKTSDTCFHYKNFGKFKQAAITPIQTLETGFCTHPDYKLVQDPYNSAKQWILKRENFQEIIMFQLVSGNQTGRAKFTECDIRTNFDFITEHSLNTLLSSNCNSSFRLYKAKHPALSGLDNNWSKSYKSLLISKRNMGFSEHVKKERKLIPLISRTITAMKKTEYCHGHPCWYLNSDIDDVLREAAQAGLVVRLSTTQVHWTDQGGLAARCFCENPTYRVYK